MLIGLNLLYLIPGKVGGTETFAAGIVRGLDEISCAHEFVVFLNQEAARWPLPGSSRFQRVVCPVTGTRRSVRYFYEQLVFPRLVKKYQVDVLHSLGYVAPLFLPCPSVVTIHDMNYRHVVDSFGRRLMLRFFVERSARRAAKVMTDSYFSKSAILAANGLPEDRVEVVYGGGYEPAEGTRAKCPAKVPGDPGLEGSYICAFSGPGLHKNLTRLMEAMALLMNQQDCPGRLVILGHAPAQLRRAAQKLRIEQIVHFTGYLERTELEAILSQALMLVFPSLYEGFGLPLLEAMACGCPVICSDRASLPEVAGDAALYFDPTSVVEIAEKILQVSSDKRLREQLVIRGQENLRSFSWNQAAQRCVAVYEAAVAASRAEDTLN